MEIENSTLITAPRDRVWAGLNNPGILQHCLSGCESLEAGDAGDAHNYTARLMVKIGPVKARFSGIITLSELNPPHSYRISGEGQGGVAGFAKGHARVELEAPDENTTKLSYWVSAEIGGKLAQLGDRLIQGTATKLSAEFFEQFTKLMNSSIDLTERYDKP